MKTLRLLYFFGAAVSIVLGLAPDATADSYVEICDDVDQIGHGNTILVTNLYWPLGEAIEEAYILMTGSISFGLYHVDPDYDEIKDLSLTVCGDLLEIDEDGHDNTEYMFEEEGEFTVRSYFDDASFLSLIGSYRLRFSIRYAAFAGVPIIDPYFENFSATLVIISDDSTYMQELSVGEVKMLWK